MNLRKVLSDDEIVQLSRLDETGAGKALLKYVDFLLNRVRLDLEQNPVVADDKRDFRFKTGMIEGLKQAEQASKDARLMVTKQEERKES
jgi:hypothetical protein